jgi:hypothetical protein
MNYPRRTSVSSSESSGGEFQDTYKVKATENDTNPDYLQGKVDDDTLQVQNNKVKVKFQDDKSENVVWSSQRITKEAIIKAIIFG